jgi:hypothetical protein
MNELTISKDFCLTRFGIDEKINFIYQNGQWTSTVEITPEIDNFLDAYKEECISNDYWNQ